MQNNSNRDIVETEEKSLALYPAKQYTAPLNIMLVEDNHGDELLTRKAIEATQISYKIQSVNRGNDVLPYLWRCRQDGPDKMPDVILLDLGLPGRDGLDVLAELNLAPAFIRAIPIVILTGYKDFKNACQIYDLCLLAYLPKPCDPVIMQEMLTAMRYNGSFL